MGTGDLVTFEAKRGHYAHVGAIVGAVVDATLVSIVVVRMLDDGPIFGGYAGGGGAMMRY